MTPEDVLARRLAAEIESELATMAALAAEFASAPQEDNSYAIRARGSMLHDFYNCVERVFLRIARELNGGVPRGEQWHRDLIDSMALEISGVRPAVVDRRLATSSASTFGFGTSSETSTAASWMPSGWRRWKNVCPTPSPLPVPHRSLRAWMVGQPEA